MKDIFNNTTTSFDNIASGINSASPKPAVTFGIKATSSMTTANDTPIGKLYITEKGLVLSGKLIAENRDSLADSFASTSLDLQLTNGKLLVTNNGTAVGSGVNIGNGDGIKAIGSGTTFGTISVDGSDVTVKNVSATTVSGPITYDNTNKQFVKYPAGTTTSNGTVSVMVTAAKVVSDGLSVASTTALGGIKVDGTTFTVNSSNLITLTGYSVTAGTGNVRNITIGGTTTTISGNSVHIPTATYVGNTETDDNKIVKKSDLSGYATTNALSSYATTSWTTSQLEDIHDEAVAAQNAANNAQTAANNAVLKWS